MHEWSLAQRLVRMIHGRLPPDERRRVKAVTLRLGESAGVAPDSLMMSFAHASAGTPIEGARLDVETVAGHELYVVALELADDGRGS